jgi:hypothetical protein
VNCKHYSEISPPEVASAYEVSKSLYLDHRSQPTQASRSFDTVLQASIRVKSSIRDLGKLRRCSDARFRALFLAREGSVEGARTAIASALEVALGGTDGPEVTLIMGSFTLAAKAYVSFRSGELERALDELGQAVIMDNELVHVPGFSILRIHLAQLAHNYMRLCLAAGDRVGCVEYCQEGLKLSEGRSAQLGDASISELGGEPEPSMTSLQQRIADQIASQVGLAVLKDQQLQGSWEALAHGIHSSCPLAASPTFQSSHVFLELITRVALGHEESVIECAARALDGLARSSPNLWILTCAVMARACDQSGRDDLATLAVKIRSEVPPQSDVHATLDAGGEERQVPDSSGSPAP